MAPALALAGKWASRPVPQVAHAHMLQIGGEERNRACVASMSPLWEQGTWSQTQSQTGQAAWTWLPHPKWPGQNYSPSSRNTKVWYKFTKALHGDWGLQRHTHAQVSDRGTPAQVPAEMQTCTGVCGDSPLQSPCQADTLMVEQHLRGPCKGALRLGKSFPLSVVNVRVSWEPRTR